MSEVLDPPLPDLVSGAIDALAAAVERVASSVEDGLWSLGSAQLLEHTAHLHREATRLDAVLHTLAREVDARGAAVNAGASSTAAWLRGRLRIHPASAKRLVETARALYDDPYAPLTHHAQAGETVPAGRPRLAAAFAAGDINAEHAAVACSG